MIDKMDKKVFAIWIGICVLGALLFSYIPNPYESDTSNKLAYEQCIAGNNIEINESVSERYIEGLPDVTEENNMKLSDEIYRYRNLLLETCGDKLGSSN